MKKQMIHLLSVAIMGVLTTEAALINRADIYVPPVLTGSGNGTLDMRLFTYSGGEIGNSSSQEGYNFDNANNALPQGNGDADINNFQESYFTSMGDYQRYYTLNFGVTNAGEIEIVLFLDLNETGAPAQATNFLNKLTFILDPTYVNGNPLDPNTNDIVGGGKQAVAGDQAYINQSYSNGTVIAELNEEELSAAGGYFNLPLDAQGAGASDYVIFTGIDPFAYSTNSTVLLNLSMDKLNNGAEEIFLDGSVSSADLMGAGIPEPMALGFICFFAIGALAIKRLFMKDS